MEHNANIQVVIVVKVATAGMVAAEHQRGVINLGRVTMVVEECKTLWWAITTLDLLEVPNAYSGPIFVSIALDNTQRPITLVSLAAERHYHFTGPLLPGSTVSLCWCSQLVRPSPSSLIGLYFEIEQHHRINTPLLSHRLNHTPSGSQSHS